MVERMIRTLKEQCLHRQRFESIQHASRAIEDWIPFYNHQRPHLEVLFLAVGIGLFIAFLLSRVAFTKKIFLSIIGTCLLLPTVIYLVGFSLIVERFSDLSGVKSLGEA